MIIFNKKGHARIGVAGGMLAVGASYCVLGTFHPIWIIFILIGSLLPDIDHPNSTFGRYNPFTGLMKHRGKCHTIIGCMLLSSPFMLISLSAFWCVLYGAILHLVSDKVYSLTSPRRRKYAIKLW